jgi:hypothetical protein
LDKVGISTIDQQPSPISVLETSFASDFADLSNLSDSSASLPPRKSAYTNHFLNIHLKSNICNFNFK